MPEPEHSPTSPSPSPSRPEEPPPGPGPSSPSPSTPPAGPSAPPLSPSAQRVQDALTAAGFPYTVVESPVSTRTAGEAARLVGCEVGQIAKSLVFRTEKTGRAILVIVSGANQVNEFRIGMYLKEAVVKAPAAFVRQATGFAIGGVAPLAHATDLPTFIDQDLTTHAEIWAAAGTPNALFKLAPADLARMSGGRVVKVT